MLVASNAGCMMTLDLSDAGCCPFMVSLGNGDVHDSHRLGEPSLSAFSLEWAKQEAGEDTP